MEREGEGGRGRERGREREGEGGVYSDEQLSHDARCDVAAEDGEPFGGVPFAPTAAVAVRIRGGGGRNKQTRRGERGRNMQTQRRVRE